MFERVGARGSLPRASTRRARLTLFHSQRREPGLEPASGLWATTLTPTEPYAGSSSETAADPITEPDP